MSPSYSTGRRATNCSSLVLAPFLQGPGLPFADVLSEERIDQAMAAEGACFGECQRAVDTPAITLWALRSQVLHVGELRSCTAAVARVIVLLVALGLVCGVDWVARVHQARLSREGVGPGHHAHRQRALSHAGHGPVVPRPLERGTRSAGDQAVALDRAAPLQEPGNDRQGDLGARAGLQPDPQDDRPGRDRRGQAAASHQLCGGAADDRRLLGPAQPNPTRPGRLGGRAVDSDRQPPGRPSSRSRGAAGRQTPPQTATAADPASGHAALPRILRSPLTALTPARAFPLARQSVRLNSAIQL